MGLSQPSSLLSSSSFCLHFLVYSRSLTFANIYVFFHTTTFNIGKFIELASALMSISRTSPLTPPLTSITKASNCEEDACDFLLISSLETLFLAKYIANTPSGVEFDKDALNIYDSIRVPRNDNTCSLHQT